MLRYLRLVLEQVEPESATIIPCAADSDKGQSGQLFSITRVDVLVEPWFPEPGVGQSQTHLDFVDPPLGAESGHEGRLGAGHDPLRQSDFTMRRGGRPNSSRRRV
jgi:hypothetical protein